MTPNRPLASKAGLRRPGTQKVGNPRASLRRSAGAGGLRLINLLLGSGMRWPSRKDGFQNSLVSLQTPSLLLTVDHGLVAAGIGAAIGSVAFAAYMIAHDNSHPVFGGAEHLMLFAQPLAPGPQQKQMDAARTPRERPFDYGATGSIGRGGRVEANDSRAKAAPASRDDDGRGDPREAALQEYVLRFVHNGAAFVQSSEGSFVVARGAILPGAGRVQAIERRAGRWVIVTESGLIGE